MSQTHRVLVVEDDPQMAKYIGLKLDYLGYEVAGQAANESRAIQLARELHPDLILMDIMLDNEDDGIETANKILSFYDVPIVYLTAHEDDVLFQRAKTTKPFGYLVKPFNDRDLNLVMDTAIYRHRQKIKLARALEDARSIINSSFDMIITVNNEGKIIEFNKAAEWELGYSHEEIIGKNILDYLSNKADLNTIRGNISQGKRVELEVDFQHKNGQDIGSLLSLSMLKDSHDGPSGILMISH